MIYKLSNDAGRETIEKEFGIPFRYPNLYRPNPVINGFHETSLSVVTMEDPKEITFAIWGLMPQDFKEDWHIFQENTNSLNVKLEELNSVGWMKDSFAQRRCLIIVTGFYTYLLENGSTHGYHIQQTSKKPFYLAGTYNRLNDGFLCTALMVNQTDPFISSYHNISNLAPVIVPKGSASTWLQKESSKESLSDIINNPKQVNLIADRMTDRFFIRKKSPFLGTQYL
ncbi:MAG: SOS response-associated peptidase [Algicola sp.]|nr:SOS response-associated peptidase [Algicola sp.]